MATTIQPRSTPASCLQYVPAAKWPIPGSTTCPAALPLPSLRSTTESAAIRAAAFTIPTTSSKFHRVQSAKPLELQLSPAATCLSNAGNPTISVWTSATAAAEPSRIQSSTFDYIWFSPVYAGASHSWSAASAVQSGAIPSTDAASFRTAATFI